MHDEKFGLAIHRLVLHAIKDGKENNPNGDTTQLLNLSPQDNIMRVFSVAPVFVLDGLSGKALMTPAMERELMWCARSANSNPVHRHSARVEPTPESGNDEIQKKLSQKSGRLPETKASGN